MFTVKPISKSLGAELYGVDLCKDLSTEIYAEIRRLLIKHQVIFFRDQDISPQQHKSLAESFGPLQTHPAYETVEGYPEITILESTAKKPSKIEVWHSDMTFRKHPPLGSVLRAKICPPKGGDTMWASMSAAYDGLSKGLQEFLSTLNAEHDFSYGFKESLAEPGGKERLAKAVEDNPPVLHPVIRTHPESNQKVIFVNALFTTKITGLPEKESSAILEFLYDHIISQEYTCRFHWEPNSIAIWDNRSTQHKPINDYFPAHRLLERIAIDGDKHY
jgi:taurine dioxygenase